jgi:virulence factor
MDDLVKIGIVGAGRGGPSSYHARSFSSIINGFEPSRVPSDWPTHSIRVEEARVEAVWDEDAAAAGALAEAFSIPRVVNRFEDMAGLVDAVILVDDISMTHQKRAPFFINEGIPAFIDKPLSNDLAEARSLVELAGKRKTLIMSASALRYARESREAAGRIEGAGRIDMATAVCQGQYMKEENLIHYGIHVLELAYSVMGSGASSVRNIGKRGSNIVKIEYDDGRVLVLMVLPDMAQIFQLNLYGRNDAVSIVVKDWDYFYWNMLHTFVEGVRKRTLPIRLEETLEVIEVLVAGMVSLREDGRIVYLGDM